MRSGMRCATRRQALAASIGAAIACAIPLPVPSIAARLRRMTWDSASARRLGQAYAAAAPIEFTSEDLARLILDSLCLDPVDLARMSDTQLRTMLNTLVRTDFERGNLTTADGWFLSLNEARLAALWV